jgi:multidrug efflux pump subunit AcrA (membrane-fusion protein)
VGQAAEGMDVRFTVDAHPDKAFHGRIDEIYPEPEIRDNIVYYKALVRLSPEDAMHLRPEMTTQCRITVRTLPGVLSIPNTAVKWVGGEQAVFVDDDGRVRRARPEFGLAGLERTRILSGLEEGQQVATRIVLPEGFAGGETP